MVAVVLSWLYGSCCPKLVILYPLASAGHKVSAVPSWSMVAAGLSRSYG